MIQKPIVFIVNQARQEMVEFAPFLEDRGYAVSIRRLEEVNSMSSGSGVLEESDLILIEISRPYSGIYRFLRELRSVQSTACVILWGEDDLEAVQMVSFLRAGVYDFLKVPFSGQRLVKTIRQGLKNRQKLQKILKLSEKLEAAYERVTEDRNRLEGLNDDLSRLHGLTQTLSASLDVEEVIRLLVAGLKEIVGCDRISVVLGRGEQRRIFTCPDREERSIGGLSGEALSVHQDFSEIDEASSGPLVRKGGSEIIIPLTVAGENIGLLRLARFSGGVYDDYQARILSMVADSLALAIRNAEMYQRVQDMAVKDELTRTLNRRALMKNLEREFKRSDRYGVPLSLILLDVDRFKEVNDGYGHLFGDQLLYVLASVLKRSIRDIDTLFRYAGDEFVIILPETGSEEALLTARRVQEIVRTHCFDLNHQPFQITVSLGVVTAPAPLIKTPAEFFHGADQALYEAKRKGRDRVDIFGGMTGIRVGREEDAGR